MFYLPFYIWTTMVECGRVGYCTKDMKEPVVEEDTTEEEDTDEDTFKKKDTKKKEDTKEKFTMKNRVQR